MVHFYVFDPARKMRLLLDLFRRGSKRLVGGGVARPSLSPRSTRKCRASPILDITMRSAPAGLVRDANYYRDDGEGGFCVFRVEDTLFKIHRYSLSREPSAFGALLSLPPRGLQGTEDFPVVLTDTVEQFRDLLWALYVLPRDLSIASNSHKPSLVCLVNIAQLSNKYCITSFENWAVEQIYISVQNPAGPLRTASSSTLAQILNVAVLCDHQPLCDLITRYLTSQILWHNLRLDDIIEIAEKHALRKLLGVGYYKKLISLEERRQQYGHGQQGTARGRYATTTTRLVFPSSGMDIEKRMRFLAAHHSLAKYWKDYLRNAPPPGFHRDHGCTTHTECEETWRRMWFEAGRVVERRFDASADVLGRLKMMMLTIRKSVSKTPGMSLQCSLAALESIAVIRDVIIEGLLDHFTEF